MRRHLLATTAAVALLLPAVASAQTAAASDSGTAADPQADPAADTDAAGSDIVVTARQREERLQDVPIAVTAISGEAIKDQQLVLVKDVAAYTPGLNINSDSAGRAFVSIRGVGTTLIDTVQPGVGIFIDGVYQPNTTYLMSPLVDVARVEVLRGPQGTLFGNNTLGGAINVITRQPGNDWEGRVDGSMAAGDNYASVSGSISGPIVADTLGLRIGAAYHKDDGFQYNTLARGNQNSTETKSINGTLRFTPSPSATITINGGYDNVIGAATPYFYSDGPRDYRLDGQTNQLSYNDIKYYAGNVKGEFDLDSLDTKVTAIAAYNQSDTNARGDGDYGPFDLLRSVLTRTLKTYTGELRLDTRWSDRFSTLIGAYFGRSTTDATSVTTLNFGALGLPLPPQVATATASSENDNYALFATGFLALDPTLDLAVGVRVDRQKLDASTAGAPAAYEATEFQPRVTLTKRWNPDFMTYASVARGVRGGGQNGPGAPNLIYRNDSVWTYELGAKAGAFDNRLTGSVAAFYNDYKDFIGANALAPSTTGVGFVAINLNSGKVESYGVEAELSYRVTDDWRVYGNATLLHARVTDATEFRQLTGYAYPGDRILFVPDANYTVGTNYALPLPREQALVLDANVVAKGDRVGGSLDAASVPVLENYYLTNLSITFRTKYFEVGAWATNLFDEKYMESYLDSSLLRRAGLPGPLVRNLAIQGNRRRAGVRGTIRF
ncbi:TonB-dependent receptor [Sphingomonas sp. Leaf412]|uniref:TonB-dependent receptor n=1 Tax=Sphingomonas sp. Leaf412 TaxID=1736370 RepID=UPI000AA0FCD1|nr:TonB-dependent receptor [Sphingomonas sp. Leaf412]